MTAIVRSFSFTWRAKSYSLPVGAAAEPVRILIREIVVDVDEEKHEVVMLLHWAGGRHSELRIKKNADGRHRRCTSLEAVEVVRRMAGRFSDEQIASTLNRLGMRTGARNTWNES